MRCRPRQCFRAIAGRPPRIDQDLYEKTNLAGLDFTYSVLSEPSRQACVQVVADNFQQDGISLNSLTNNGVLFVHTKSGGVATCHEVSGNVYATYREGCCFLFEALTDTICPEVGDGARELTSAELKALARHLDSIIRTVTIKPGL